MNLIFKILIPMFLLFCSGTYFAMASSAKYKFSIPTLDNNEYNQQMESGKKIAVAFNATWCPACMAQLKALDSLLPKYNSKISIFAYDWDAIDTFAGPKVNQRTTIAIFQNGKIIDELIGETRAEKIASFLDKNTKK